MFIFIYHDCEVITNNTLFYNLISYKQSHTFVLKHNKSTNEFRRSTHFTGDLKSHDLQNLKVLDLFNSCNIYSDSVHRCEMLLVGENVVCSANMIINEYHKWETAYDCY